MSPDDEQEAKKTSAAQTNAVAARVTDVDIPMVSMQ
jgi:hypothetical protein